MDHEMVSPRWAAGPQVREHTPGLADRRLDLRDATSEDGLRHFLGRQSDPVKEYDDFRDFFLFAP